jgi:hypothetical protein
MRTLALIVGLLLKATLVHAGLSAAPVVQIFAADASAYETLRLVITEATPSSRHAGFVISRGCCTVESLRVLYTVRGTASNGVDYAMLTGHATIPAGRHTVRVTINPVYDGILEPQETVILTLRSNPAYRLGQNIKAKVIIADITPPPPQDDRTGFVAPGFHFWNPSPSP